MLIWMGGTGLSEAETYIGLGYDNALFSDGVVLLLCRVALEE